MMDKSKSDVVEDLLKILCITAPGNRLLRLVPEWPAVPYSRVSWKLLKPLTTR